MDGLSIVIPTKNRVPDLISCVDQLLYYNKSIINSEILIVDDGSDYLNSFLLYKYVAELRARYSIQVSYHRKINSGPAAARNVGMLKSKYDVVVFIDSDTLPHKQLLDQLHLAIRQPHISGCEGAVLRPKGSVSPLQDAPINRGGAYLTANFAVKKSELTKINGFNENFKLPAFEDVDLAYRLLENGKLVFAAKASVLHPYRTLNFANIRRRVQSIKYLYMFVRQHRFIGWRHKPVDKHHFKLYFALLVALPIGRFLHNIRKIVRYPSATIYFYLLLLIETLLSFYHIMLLPAGRPSTTK